jgi:hypothetical protein
MIRHASLAAWIAGAMLLGGQAHAQEAQPQFSADSLYNLANSFARAGKPGMAVLNYERAGLLAPNDADIEANLRLVRQSAHQPDPSRNGLQRLATIASPQIMAWMGVLGMVIVGAGWVSGALSARFRWIRRMGMVAGVLLAGLAVGNAMVLWPTLHAGVIISAQAPVRVAPVPMGDSLFVLPEAETVTIKAEHEGFVLIETRAGRTGWVSQANLAAVVPRKLGVPQ